MPSTNTGGLVGLAAAPAAWVVGVALAVFPERERE
jgi:hypothetical protein